MVRLKWKLGRWISGLVGMHVMEIRLRLAEQRIEKLMEGIELGVNIAPRSSGDTTIVILSRLGPGSIKIFDLQFGDMRAMEYFVRNMKELYQIREPIWYDAPYGMHDNIKQNFPR